MKTNEIAVEYRLSYWANIIRERKESGLNVKAFCQNIGIHSNTYFYWQKKLREAACTEYLQLPIMQPLLKKETIPNGWAVCEPMKTKTNNETICIEIGKGRVLVTAGVDDELLSAVCRTLADIC